MTFKDSVLHSLELFSKHPKFIVPKLIIAALYSVTILLTAGLTIDAFSDPQAVLLFDLLLLLFASFGITLVDIFVSAMYPFMVEQAKKGEISLKGAVSEVSKRGKKIFFSVILVELGFLAASFIISVPLAILIYFSDEVYTILFSILYFVILVAIVFLFYALYPVLAFEKGKVIESLKSSIRFSMGNKSDVGKATLLSAFLSTLSFGIAFAIELFPQVEGTVLFWFGFIIVRFLTAYIYSYLFVLSPVLYSEAGK